LELEPEVSLRVICSSFGVLDDEVVYTVFDQVDRFVEVAAGAVEFTFDDDLGVSHIDSLTRTRLLMLLPPITFVEGALEDVLALLLVRAV